MLSQIKSRNISIAKSTFKKKLYIIMTLNYSHTYLVEIYLISISTFKQFYIFDDIISSNPSIEILIAYVLKVILLQFNF